MSSPSTGRHRRRARLRARALTLGATVLLGTAAACVTPPGPDPAAPQLYRNPDTQAAAWVAANPDDARAAVIRDRIVSQPQAKWFTNADPNAIAGQVRDYVRPAAEAGTVPVLVAYAIPYRDCGGASGGGAAAMATWRSWIAGMAQGLGTTRAIVLLEPDALALEDCLDAARRQERHQALTDAVTTLTGTAPNVDVYLDAGHSGWHGAEEQARRLREAGVLGASGFVTNVSNFRTTEAEIAYGQGILAALGQPDLKQVIDVSRNGNGPAPGDAWCDPPGRALGRTPTLSTGQATVAGYLWVKLPGEADGCAAGAGSFVPDLAHALATN